MYLRHYEHVQNIFLTIQRTIIQNIITRLYLYVHFACTKGWWLSMESQDAFFKRLNSIHDFERLYEKSERFGTWNEKTLGIILVSEQ